jgi:hypothetical protein
MLPGSASYVENFIISDPISDDISYPNRALVIESLVVR